jgi:hypothetical protein
MGEHHPRRRSSYRISAKNLTATPPHKEMVPAPYSCQTGIHAFILLRPCLSRLTTFE